MKKTIYHDAILNFGKYKGATVADVLVADPGYFLWCRVADKYALDAVVTNTVDAWVAANKAEASKVTASAQKVRANSQDTLVKSIPEFTPSESVTREVSFAKHAERDSSWGSW